MKLIYWNIRGFRAPINYCLEYAGETYEEDLFDLVPDKDGKYNFTTSYSESRWGKELKHKSECDFPNIPCLIDGDVKLSQSFAIMAYVCRKNKVLLPKNDTEATQMDMMNGVVNDWRQAFCMICYMPQSDTALEDYQNPTEASVMSKNLPGWRNNMNKFLQKNKYCAGETITDRK